MGQSWNCYQQLSFDSIYTVKFQCDERSRIPQIVCGKKLDVDYDEEADVPYVSFGPPEAASES